MALTWDKRHGKILTDFLCQLKQNKIKYFIIRGFEGLPDSNMSKDVDIMVEVGKEAFASNLLRQTFKENNLEYIHSDVFGHIHCYIGMSPEQEISIHIDLVEGYISMGYEIFTFEELYDHVVDYNGIKVLDEYMNGIMLIVYKIFGYHKAKLKESYRKDIYMAYITYKEQFVKDMRKLVGNELADKICRIIENKQFDELLKLEPLFTKQLKRYTIKKRPLKTFGYIVEFLWQKINRIVFSYRKYAKTFAVMAPDGTGKTTFLDALIEKMNFYYVNDENDHRFHVYHFRPEILPNLGQVGEKAGVMKQDTNFTDPHRSKPANPLSSLVRIAYYTLDYIIGWQKCVRNDVHYDRYSIFDRYSYDFIVDPLRTKLNLPKWIRKMFVALTPQPKVVFFLNASPETVYARKKELELQEIERQSKEYLELAQSKPNKFIIIDAEQNPNQMADDAVRVILNKYTKKL